MLCISTTIAMAQACCLPGHTGNGKREVEIKGTIAEGDDIRLVQFLNMYPDAVMVGLDSPGGALVPALAMGRIIYARHLGTGVGNNRLCASACALIWLAGAQKKNAWTTASIGFHAAFNKETGREGLGSALVGKYLGELGFSDQAIVWMNEQDAEHLNFLDLSVVEKLRLDMTLYNPKEGFNYRIRDGQIVHATPIVSMCGMLIDNVRVNCN
jgi:hypothetical protein